MIDCGHASLGTFGGNPSQPTEACRCWRVAWACCAKALRLQATCPPDRGRCSQLRHTVRHVAPYNSTSEPFQSTSAAGHRVRTTFSSGTGWAGGGPVRRRIVRRTASSFSAICSKPPVKNAMSEWLVFASMRGNLFITSAKRLHVCSHTPWRHAKGEPSRRT